MIQCDKNTAGRLRNSDASPSVEVNASLHKNFNGATKGKSAKDVNQGKGVAKGSNRRGKVTSARADFMTNLQELSRGKSKKKMITSDQSNNDSTNRGSLGNKQERMCVGSSDLSQLDKANFITMRDEDELSEDYPALDRTLNPNLRSRYRDYDKIKSNSNFSCGKMPGGPSCSGIDSLKVSPTTTSENRTNGTLKRRGTKNDRKLLKRKRADLTDKEFATDIYLGKGFKQEPSKVDHNHLNLTNVDITTGVPCRDHEVEPKERNTVKGKRIRRKTLADEWPEFTDVLLPCYKSARGKSLKRNYPSVKIQRRNLCPVRSSGEKHSCFDKKTSCKVVGEARHISYPKRDGNIVRAKCLSKAGCSTTTTCKGEITAKDNRKYGGIWQKDDDCVITCVRRITEKERNRQEAILEANVVDSHSWFTRPFTKE